MSVLKGQKLVENAKIQKSKCDILSNFQTMWIPEKITRKLGAFTAGTNSDKKCCIMMVADRYNCQR